MPTKIEWADESWNPVTGCTKVDEGCRNCYAERMSKRLRGRCGYPADDPFRVTLQPDRLDKPLHWKKPRKIFVNSMSDLFHKDMPFEFVDHIFTIMALAESHQFMILTKRPDIMLGYFNDLRGGKYDTRALVETQYGRPYRAMPWLSMKLLPMNNVKFLTWPLPNVWLGVSVHDQKSADERIPILLQTPAAYRFVSQEPALGTVDFKRATHRNVAERQRALGVSYFQATHLDLIITGGESGPGARPMHPDIPRSTRDQCKAAGVPFMFKQWGDWGPGDSKKKLNCCVSNHHSPSLKTYRYQEKAGQYGINDCICMQLDRPSGRHSHPYREQCEMMSKVGKKAAGRRLDGVVHNG